MFDIKAIFFDIDWTIYDHKNHRFAPKTIEAIKAVKKSHPDMKLVLCTARSHDSFRKLGALDLGITWDGFVESAGAVVKVGDEIVFKSVLDPRDAENFVKTASEKGLCFEAVGLNGRWLMMPLTEDAKVFYSKYCEVVSPREDYHGQELTSFNLFATAENEGDLQKLNPNLNFYRYFEYGCDVTKEQHDKGPALDILLAHFGLKKENALGFGDDIQDISMAEHVGLFIALGNAKDEVKKAAHGVTLPVWEDGVGEALEKLGLTK